MKLFIFYYKSISHATTSYELGIELFRKFEESPPKRLAITFSNPKKKGGEKCE